MDFCCGEGDSFEKHLVQISCETQALPSKSIMKSSEEIVSSESTSKPIKKRVVNDDGAGDDDDFEDYHGCRSSSNGNYSVSSDTSSENISYESKARKELSDFLENKGIDASREMVGYRVLLQHSKNRRLPAGTFSVTYSGPDGDILSSKTDVFNAIKRNMSQSNKFSISRSDIYASAQRKLEDFMNEEGLPASIDDIRVISFGTIDSDNSSFHNSIEIYPVGYRAEISLPAAPAIRGKSSAKSTKVNVVPFLLIVTNRWMTFYSDRLDSLFSVW